MTDHDRLFDAVLAHPGDDTPRLIYADYLDEQGGPVNVARAKLIRLECERARLPDGHSDRSRLDRLCQTYPERLAPLLIAELSEAERTNVQYGEWTLDFDRGIPTRVLWDELPRMEGAEFWLPRLAPGMAARVDLTINDPDSNAAGRWATNWRLADRVTRLTVRTGPDVPTETVVVLLPGPFPRLQELNALALGYQPGDQALAGLATAAPPPLLRRLALAASPHITTAGLSALVGGRLCAGLCELLVVTNAFQRLFETVPRDRPGQGVQYPYWFEYDVPRPGRPPLVVRVEGGIPF